MIFSHQSNLPNTAGGSQARGFKEAVVGPVFEAIYEGFAVG